VLIGHCGIPEEVRAVSVNITVVQPTAAGDLRLFPRGRSSRSFPPSTNRAGQTRRTTWSRDSAATATSAFVATGSGKVHLIVDVNGYFK
jgi:hypothetical protein